MAQLRLINLAGPQGRDCHNEKVKSVGSSEKYECFIVNCIFNFFLGGGCFGQKHICISCLVLKLNLIALSEGVYVVSNS